MPQNDFAARLARIEAKRPVSEPPAPADTGGESLFDTAPQAEAQATGMELPPGVPPQGKRGGGIARMLAWVGLLVGLGAMGTVGAVIMTEGKTTFAPTDVTSNTPLTPAGQVAIATADGLAPPHTGPAWWDGDRGLTRLFGPELFSGRNITAKKYIALQDMPDEAQGVDLDTFAKEHAATYFDGYCAEMRKVLAADCANGRFSAEMTEDSRFVELSGEFLFAPSLWTGTAQQIANGRSHKGEFDLTASGDLPDTPESRGEVYARAVSLCGGLRVMFGNCAIESISFRSVGDPADGRVAAVAAVYVYAPEDQLDRNRLRAEIARVTRVRDQALFVLSML